MKKWTTEEDNILRDNCQLTDKELTVILNDRTESAIYARRKKLGIKKKKIIKYSFEDVQKEFSKRGYILISTSNDYQNVHSKMRYICSKHKDVGEQQIDYSHLKSGRGCYYCGRERTIAAKTKELNKEHDKELVESKGLEYVDTRRENGRIYIDYICPKHRELGVQSMYQWYMLEKAVGCQYCHGHTPPEWYIMKKINEINPDIELLEPYENMSKRIKCRCKKHDYISTKSVQEILTGRGCKFCGAEKLSDQHFLSDDEIQERVSRKHPHVKLIKYCGINSKDTEWLCTKHNIQFKKVLSTMLRSTESGCDICYKERMQREFGLTYEEFLSRLHSVHSELEVVGEYNGLTKQITVHCNTHNHTYTANANDILSRLSCCPRSFKTYKEEVMCSLIESWGYKIDRQHVFDDCKDQNVLRFDCFLVDFNTVVEYDGENHFYPVKFGTQSIEEAIEKYEYTKAHDEIKNKYCMDNNINIIRVPYYQFDDMEYFLFDKFSELNIITEIKVS